ncbi:SAG-related sequence SRS25 [Toxoplasma gondii VAND]|uniref:SAG-related sequence SRS25 n=1 Tax=Toxoplasma gondii VAND TaxID=933077 RepID=A0A086Q7M7_TOXGO|nr:SAG-related sequence SRS25 [Toxoplasma gondii VAND]
MRTSRLLCAFGAVLLCWVPSWTAHAEEHFAVFSTCRTSFGRKRILVHSGDSVTIQCPGAIASNPQDVSKYACPGEEPNCTDATKATYQTMFPIAPPDFEFWSGGDSKSNYGILKIPEVKDPVTISYSWQAAHSTFTGHAANSQLILDVNPKEEEVTRTVTSTVVVVSGCETQSLFTFLLVVASGIAMQQVL